MRRNNHHARVDRRKKGIDKVIPEDPIAVALVQDYLGLYTHASCMECHYVWRFQLLTEGSRIDRMQCLCGGLLLGAT
jgi:hypothetical protein